MKPRRTHVLPAATGWTQGAMRWLAHEVPLREALTVIAISELRSPREILERIDELYRK